MSYRKRQETVWQTVRRERKLWFWPMAVMLVVVVMTALVVVPVIGQIRADLDEIEQRKDRLTQLVEKRARLEALDEETLNTQLSGVNRLLPSQKPIMEAVGALGGTAATAGATLQSYSFTPGELEGVPGVLEPLPIETVVVGDYKTLVNFLTIIDQTAPLIYVETVGLDGLLAGQVESSESWGGSMETAIHYSQPVLNLGEVADPLPALSTAGETILATLEQYQTFATELPPATTEDRGNYFEY